MSSVSEVPDVVERLKAIAVNRPLAIILAGHNGSGKSSFWYQKLCDELQLPLLNADRLTLSILPEPDADTRALRPWAAKLRDKDEGWQRLSQSTVTSLLHLVVKQRMPFAYETVFSHLVQNSDGTWQSKAELIAKFQDAGYAVALLFVGLANVSLSVGRVEARRAQGGHSVPEDKLLERFGRTQKAVSLAAPLADITMMFDNSRRLTDAFSLVRAQEKEEVLYDCRFDAAAPPALVEIARIWLAQVAPLDAANAAEAHRIRQARPVLRPRKPL